MERLLILSRIGIAAVLVESTLSFLHLPSLDPVPSRILPSIKGVSTVVLDDAEAQHGGTDAEGFVSLCILKRRQAILTKVGLGRWIPIKEVSLPQGCVMARRFGDCLCTASATEYSLINLTTSQITPLNLPISHSSEAPSASTRPSMLSLPQQRPSGDPVEFLITSHSEQQTLGVFVQADGEPSPKLIEWTSHPRALFIEWPNLISLLRDDTVRVHDLRSMQEIQTIHLPEMLEPRTLSSGVSRLDINSGRIFNFDQYQQSIEGNLTASIEEKWILYSSARKHSFWRSMILDASSRSATTLMICKNAIQGLVEPVPLASAPELIAKGRWSALEALLAEAWTEEEARKVASPDQPLSYQGKVIASIYGLLALRQIDTVDFYSATTSFSRSSLDVRLLMRMFPNLCIEHVWKARLSVIAPLKELAKSWSPVTDLIRENLTWLYAPHSRHESSTELQLLEKRLLTRAYEMLEAVLEGCRANFKDRTEAELRRAVDTALAKLYAHKGDRMRFVALLRSTNNAVDGQSIEEEARQAQAMGTLAELHYSRKNWEETLAIWTDILDGRLDDSDFNRNIGDIVQLVQNCSAETQQRYAFWVVKHDAQAGVKLLAAVQSLASTQHPDRDGTTSAAAFAPPSDGQAHQIIAELERAGAQEAVDSFVEQLVLGQKRQDAELHERLIDILLSRVLDALKSEQAKNFYSQVTRDYQQGAYAESFLGHLALQSTSAPSVAAVPDRLKLILLLQGSKVYNIDRVLKRAANDSLLAYERAVLLGKLEHHHLALEVLAVELHDANSAEAYCCQGGIVVSPWVAKQIIGAASLDELEAYARLLARGVRSSRKLQPDLRDSLLRELLSVYMKGTQGRKETIASATSSLHPGSEKEETPSAPLDDEFNIAATAHLLNTQALHLSALDILPLVPEEWPLSTLSTFLGRNLRRESHRRHEGSIKRALALSHSLEQAERAWSTMRAAGGFIQDGEEDGDSDGQNESRASDAEVSEEKEKSIIPTKESKPRTDDIVVEIPKTQEEKSGTWVQRHGSEPPRTGQ